jgi:arsenite oxidase small subunit
MTASAVLAVAGIAAITKSVTNAAETSITTGPGTFPKTLVTNVNGLQVNNPVSFNYPLDNEPNLLVKLGQKAVGGVGPDGDIVAFSNICQHLGCVYGFQAPGTSPPCASSFVAKGPMGYCCCHGSQYDFLNGAAVIGGPAPRAVPSVILEVDSTGNIYATGMNPPTIFGHNTGSTDVSADLQGGNAVGGSTA